VLSTVERERTLRHVRVDIPGAAATSGERGHPGPRGRPGAGTPLPLVLQQPAPAAPLRAEAIEADAVESSALEALQVPSSVAPFAAPAPDVDALARQVLDRIERRAIAQRERMGRI
jgi:hypothetical protein